jgi:hypothetical protein
MSELESGDEMVFAEQRRFAGMGWRVEVLRLAGKTTYHCYRYQRRDDKWIPMANAPADDWPRACKITSEWMQMPELVAITEQAATALKKGWITLPMIASPESYEPLPLLKFMPGQFVERDGKKYEAFEFRTPLGRPEDPPQATFKEVLPEWITPTDVDAMSRPKVEAWNGHENGRGLSKRTGYLVAVSSESMDRFYVMNPAGVVHRWYHCRMKNPAFIEAKDG